MLNRIKFSPNFPFPVKDDNLCCWENVLGYILEFCFCLMLCEGDTKTAVSNFSLLLVFLTFYIGSYVTIGNYKKCF